MSININDIKNFIKYNQDEYIKLETILTSKIALAPENGEMESFKNVLF